MTAADLELGRVYPAVRNIHEVSVRVAVELVKYLYEVQLAARQPQPSDIEACVRSQLYSPHYNTAALVPNSS